MPRIRTDEIRDFLSNETQNKKHGDNGNELVHSAFNCSCMMGITANIAASDIFVKNMLFIRPRRPPYKEYGRCSACESISAYHSIFLFISHDDKPSFRLLLQQQYCILGRKYLVLYCPSRSMNTFILRLRHIRVPSHRKITMVVAIGIHILMRDVAKAIRSRR